MADKAASSRTLPSGADNLASWLDCWRANGLVPNGSLEASLMMLASSIPISRASSEIGLPG
jgi:hypothetical protein